MLNAGWGLGVKVINAGGAAAFKSNVRAFSFDDEVPGYGVSSRDIVLALQEAVQALGVPHPLHVHCNNLGLPGSADTAHLTIEAAGDTPMHLAHLQFYGYGAEGKRGISSAAARLAERVNATPNVTIDVGQVMFGPTVTVSSDTLRQFAQRGFARPKKWTLWDGDGNGGGDHPDRIPRARFRQRAAMGDRPGAVPADRRSVAGLFHHRSSERRALHPLSGNPPPADGRRTSAARWMERLPKARDRDDDACRR